MKQNMRNWVKLSRRGVAFLLAAVMVMGFWMPVNATDDVTAPTVAETTLATEPETVETTAPAEPSAQAESSEPTVESSEPAVESSEEVTSEPTSSETTEPETTVPETTVGDDAPGVPDTTVPEQVETNDQPVMAPAPEKSAYELAMEKLAAMAEEAETLEATEEVLDEYYERLRELYSNTFDLYDTDAITADQWDAFDAKFLEILTYLETTYGYVDGKIQTYADIITVDNDGITPINATVKVFNYDATVNTADKVMASDGKPIFPFKHNYVGDTKDGVGDSQTARHNTNRRSGSGTGFGIARKLNDNGYPVVTNWLDDGTGDSWKSTSNPNLKNSGSTIIGSLDYLFSESSSYFVGKSTDGAGLFQDIGNDFVEYDSYKNAAWFNTETNRFVLYNELVRPQSRRTTTSSIYYGNFLPFNDPAKMDLDTPISWDGKTSYNIQAYSGTSTPADDGRTVSTNTNNKLDMWFGMTVEFDFAMPKDGLVNGKVMQFDFTGDDDVYVFIDDVMILNIGGSHEAQRAWINFRTGEIYDQLSSLSGNLNTTDANGNTVYATTTIKDRFEQAGESTATGFEGNTFAEYTTHTLKFFYLERGGCDSSCRLKFNIQTLPANSLTVAKDVKNDPKDTEFRFQAVLKDEKGQPLEKVDYYLNGEKQAEPMTLKEGGIAEFSLADGEYITFDLAVGYSYVVEELDADKNGYVTTKPTSETGTLNDTDSAYLLYTNEYVPGQAGTDKTVAEGDKLGEYVIDLSAWSTAEIITNEYNIPVDTVFVLDQSASMYKPAMAATDLTCHDHFGGNLGTESSAQEKQDTGEMSRSEFLKIFTNGYGTHTAAEMKERAAHSGYFIGRVNTDSGEFRGLWYILKYGEKDGTEGFYFRRACKTNAVFSSDLVDFHTCEQCHTDQHDTKLATANQWSGFIPMTKLAIDTGPDRYYFTQYAKMYDAVVDYIDEAKESGVNHRIGLVGFAGENAGNSAVFVNGSKYHQSSVTEDQYASALVDVQTAYDGIMESVDLMVSEHSGTQTSLGLTMAENVFAHSTKPAGETVERNRVVILLTDGQPTEELDITISAAKPIKQPIDKDGCGASVYAICTCSGDIDADRKDFLSCISSEYPDATSIDEKGERATGTYSFMEANAEKVAEILEQIKRNELLNIFTMDATTILRDVMSDDFVIPNEKIGQIQAYRVPYTGNGTFEADENKWTNVTKDVTIKVYDAQGNETTTVDGKRVDVTGFDYSAGYVIDYDDSTYSGYKLVVRVPIEPSETNKGGNKQATNNDNESGIFNGQGERIEEFDQPHVDTPVDVTVKKKVTGNMGDWSKEFTFTATVTEYTKTDGKYYDNKPDSQVGNSNYLEAKDRVQEVTYEGDTAIKLKNGESKLLDNLYYGSTVTITEAPENYTLEQLVAFADANGNGEYDNDEETITTTNKYDANRKLIGVELTATKDMVILFTNDYTVTIDTGIALDSLPYILIIAVVLVGGAFLFLRKRKLEE